MELLGLAGWGRPVCEATAPHPGSESQEQRARNPCWLDCSSAVHSPAWEKQQLGWAHNSPLPGQKGQPVAMWP